jgi:flagellar assembly protein FliH
MFRIIKADKSTNVAAQDAAGDAGFVDISQQLTTQQRQAREEASRIIAAANRQSEQIRAEAERFGREQGEAELQKRVQTEVQARLNTLQPALQQAIEAIRDSRAEHLKKCESNMIQLAIAIAERVVRRELRHAPDITLDLLREALDLATGSGKIRILLHPNDYQKLGLQAQQLIASRCDGIAAEIQSDADVSPGGCIVQSEFGSIDQCLESQLDRILEELI